MDQSTLTLCRARPSLPRCCHPHWLRRALWAFRIGLGPSFMLSERSIVSLFSITYLVLLTHSTVVVEAKPAGTSWRAGGSEARTPPGVAITPSVRIRQQRTTAPSLYKQRVNSSS